MISDPSSSTTINLAAALGPPTLVTDPGGLYGGVVTPLNPPFGPGELISIGEGGWLTVRFDEPVTDDVRNPYGVDLLIFGNAFIGGDFFNADFSFKPAGLAAGVASEGGLIEVSSDGKNFFPVGGEADGLFPTNAFADVEHPFAAAPGRIEADFTKPVNPAFSPVGKTFAQIIAGYEGSGGGCGVDIAAAGLSSISYVRITNPTGSGVTPEIDALADVTAVPEPGGAALFLVFSVLFAWQKRARRYGEERGGFVAGIA
ncbi:MAG: hypothetical protein IT424_11570 [Pirellulales bacterium]|nr:hypothetical protein [Pirellulales bacterium]